MLLQQYLLASALALAWLCTAVNPLAAQGPPANNEPFEQPLTRATRCATCHPNQFLEWSSSIHGYAAVSPTFFALEQIGAVLFPGQFREGQVFCITCHVPGIRVTGELNPGQGPVPRFTPGNRFAGGVFPYGLAHGKDLANSMFNEFNAEGISCDICHNVVLPDDLSPPLPDGRTPDSPDIFTNSFLPQFQIDPATGERLDVDTPAEHRFFAVNSHKLGPIADPVPNTFHTYELKPQSMDFIRSSEFCGSCHDVRAPIPGTNRNFELQDDDRNIPENSGGRGFLTVENLFSEHQRGPWARPSATGEDVLGAQENDELYPPSEEIEPGSGLTLAQRRQRLEDYLVETYGLDRDAVAVRAFTCQDCHMSLYPAATDGTPIAPGTYAMGPIAVDDDEDFSTPFEPPIRPRISTHYMTGMDIALIHSELSLDPEDGGTFTFPSQGINFETGQDEEPIVVDYNLADGRSVTVFRSQHQRREQLLEAAVRIDVRRVDDEPVRPGGVLSLEVECENVGAGHNVPAGFSEARETTVHLVVTERATGRVIYESGYFGHRPEGPMTYGDLDRDGDGSVHDEDLDHFRFEETRERAVDDAAMISSIGEVIVELGPDAHLRKLEEVTHEPVEFGPTEIDPRTGQPYQNLGLVNFQNGFYRFDPEDPESSEEELFFLFLGPKAVNVGHAVAELEGGADNNFSLPPFAPRVFRYDVPIPDDVSGEVDVSATMRYRHFPPRFLREMGHAELEPNEVERYRQRIQMGPDAPLVQPNGPFISLGGDEETVMVELEEALEIARELVPERLVDNLRIIEGRSDGLSLELATDRDGNGSGNGSGSGGGVRGGGSACGAMGGGCGAGLVLPLALGTALFPLRRITRRRSR